MPTALRVWPECQVRRASVNSFGFGGANAHAIIDAYTNEKTPVENGENTEIDRERRLFLITANDQEAGKAYARCVSSHLESCKNYGQERAGLSSRLAFTLGERRSLHMYRFAVTASSVSELSVSLKQNGLSFTKSFSKLDLVYVFTGQGAQWFAMGRELIKEYPIFRTTIIAAERYLKTLGASWSLHGKSLLLVTCL